jgi:hypothetical protein
MSASETPFVAAADVMNPARRLCAAKSPSMPAASVKRFTSRAMSIGAIRFAVSFLPPLNVRNTRPSTRRTVFEQSRGDLRSKPHGNNGGRIQNPRRS